MIDIHPQRIQQVVDSVFSTYSTLQGGKNADYIPYLAQVPAELAAVVVVTRDGKIYHAGDSQYRFALESISKVSTLALALEDVGPDVVQAKIGASPTGLPFNSVMALELHNDKPFSSLVNAGAMSTATEDATATRGGGSGFVR